MEEKISSRYSDHSFLTCPQIEQNDATHRKDRSNYRETAGVIALGEHGKRHHDNGSQGNDGENDPAFETLESELKKAYPDDRTKDRRPEEPRSDAPIKRRSPSFPIFF